MEASEDPGEARPAAAAILSAAVAQAVAQTDAKLALDMLLLHEQLLAADAEGRARCDENAALRDALAALKQEQSAMHVYLHGKLDAQVARVEELERALAAAHDARAELEKEAQEKLEALEASHKTQLEALGEQDKHLREELRKVRVFMEQQRELEGETSALRVKLAAQQAAFVEREAALERKFLVELDRGKKELLARMQATKEALVARTAGQLNTTTKRTMMENEQFMEELAFQSRESEALVERLGALEKELRALKVRNGVLEANETALAKKAHYYRRILKQMRGAAARDDGRRGARRSDSDESSEEDSEGDGEEGGGSVRAPEEELQALREKAAELERKLRRALDWLRVVEADKQLLLARQDEALQFLLAALDEGARQIGGDPETEAEEDARVALAGDTTSVEGLVTLFPRPLAPALDELETRALLRFLVEKLRMHQQQVAAVFHAQQQPQPSPKQRAKGLELPPISGGKSPTAAKTKAASSTTTSPLKRRAFFAHVTAAIAREEAASTSSRPTPSPSSSVTPELMAMATGQFNFLAPTAAKSKHKAVASPSPSPVRRAPTKFASNKSAKTSTLALAASDSTAELLTPWPTGDGECGEQESDEAATVSVGL